MPILSAMRFDVLTLFPEMVFTAAGFGVTGKAQEREIVTLYAWNPRDYAFDKHRRLMTAPMAVAQAW